MLILLLIAGRGPLFAQEPLLRLVEEDAAAAAFSGGTLHRTAAQLNDATLLDVCSVGSFCAAVGERGVVCLSADGGRTWETLAVPFECRLTAVCFLTNRVGWLAGRREMAGRPCGAAVLLETRDGGATWRDLTSSGAQAGVVGGVARLPGIEQLQFFGLEDALAICGPDAEFGGATVFRSRDGGETWQAIESDRPAAPWLAMGCFSAEEAVLGGLRQQSGTLVSGELVVLEEPRRTLRSFRGISVDRDGGGWLGGDGGILLQTQDGGVTWQAAAGEFPRGLSEVLDIRTVAHRNGTVLAGGFPGTTLACSDDGGSSWEVRHLPLQGVLQRLRPLGENGFVGVGTFGMIVRSDDAGATWACVRGEGRHCGVLNLVTEGDSCAWELLARESAELGLRAAVVQPSGLLGVGSDDGPFRAEQQRERQALTLLAVNEIEHDWMFPREQRLQHVSRQALLSGWERQTDGRLGELLPLRLARSFCAFRPLIVAVEPLAGDDAVCELLLEALPRALELAAEPGGTSLEAAGLESWRPLRVVRRLPQRQRSALQYSRDELLECCGTSLGLACAGVWSAAGLERSRLIESAGGGSVAYGSWPDSEAAVERLTAGLERQLTSAVRRAVTRRSREDLEELRAILRRGRLESAALGGTDGLQGGAEAFVGHLETAGAELPVALAEQQLSELAALCVERNNVEGYLAVQQELVRRFPGSAAAWHAAEELLLMYSSAEVRHYRLGRGAPGPSGRRAVDEMAVDGAAAAVAVADTAAAGDGVLRPRIEPGTSTPFGGPRTAQQTAVNETWDRQAQTAWKLLQRHAQGEFGVLRALPPTASLRRGISLARSQSSGEAASLLTGLAKRRDQPGRWAESEFQQQQGLRSVWLRTVNLEMSVLRPLLDGQLSDEIWQAAGELVLEPAAGERSAAAEAPRSLAMLAWDSEFLYISARLARAEGRELLQAAAERHYDEPHGERDRLEVCVDTDRDLLTAFRLTIDETGRTDDACWKLTKWNPRWYVATDADEGSWRVECAVPLAELSAEAVRPGTLWSVRLRRLCPGQADQQVPVAEADPGQVATVSADGAVLVRLIRPQSGRR
ncbi:MAG: hypothetical protein ACKO2P_10620 [Planctomycetota bacterium]